LDKKDGFAISVINLDTRASATAAAAAAAAAAILWSLLLLVLPPAVVPLRLLPSSAAVAVECESVLMLPL
jgi:hypothetical protein